MPPDEQVTGRTDGAARQWRDMATRCLLTPVGPLLLFAILAALSMAQKSPTFDEAALLASGARYLRTWDNSVNAENPPFLKAVYALPTLLYPGLDIPAAPDSLRLTDSMPDQAAFGNTFLYSQRRPRRLLFCCRCMAVFVGLLLGAAVYIAAARIWNRSTAVLVLWVYALSPNILAHSRLVTPDVGCALSIFVSTLALLRVLQHRRWVYVLGAGLALGLAQMTKYTALILVPMMAVQAGCYISLNRGTWRDFAHALCRLFACGCVALVVMNSFYRFEGFGRSLSQETYRSGLVQFFQEMPVVGHLPLPVPVPYVKGFDIVAYNNRPGLPNIFLGKLYPEGGSWWYYYAVVLALKMPLALLAAVVLGGVALTRKRSRDWASISVLAVPPATFLLIFSFIAYRQLGLRYILPVWPFLLLLLGAGLSHIRATAPRARELRLGAGLLATWYALSSLAAFPHYLTYFNGIAGGPGNGWRYLAVSNSDWGQDLPALAEWQEENNAPDMYVLYYGTAPLEAFGVREQPWATLPLPPYMAISTTKYFLCADVPLVAYLRSKTEPVARLGNTIHIYELDDALRHEFRRRAQPPAESASPATAAPDG